MLKISYLDWQKKNQKKIQLKNNHKENKKKINSRNKIIEKKRRKMSKTKQKIFQKMKIMMSKNIKILFIVIHIPSQSRKDWIKFIFFYFTRPNSKRIKI